MHRLVALVVDRDTSLLPDATRRRRDRLRPRDRRTACPSRTGAAGRLRRSDSRHDLLGHASRGRGRHLAGRVDGVAARHRRGPGAPGSRAPDRSANFENSRISPGSGVDVHGGGGLCASRRAACPSDQGLHSYCCPRHDGRTQPDTPVARGLRSMVCLVPPRRRAPRARAPRSARLPGPAAGGLCVRDVLVPPAGPRRGLAPSPRARTGVRRRRSRSGNLADELCGSPARSRQGRHHGPAHTGGGVRDAVPVEPAHWRDPG